uniref:Uncharacterized protein n=1 Tax=Arundo donax TaxID=35708 RepID=A0A0A9EM65_ARUDO
MIKNGHHRRHVMVTFFFFFFVRMGGWSLELERRRGAGPAGVGRPGLRRRGGGPEVVGLPGLLRRLHRRRRGLEALGGEVVLVVVHPDLEDAAFDADLLAEGLHHAVVELLEAPPDALRELQHARLLLRGELGAEPLLGRRQAAAAAARGVAGGAVHLVGLGGVLHHAQRHDVLVVVVGVGVPRRRGRQRARRGVGAVGVGGDQEPAAAAVLVVRHGGGEEAVGACAVAVAETVRGAAVGDVEVVVVDLLAVEVAVAAAGGALERLQRALLAARHELAAPVGGVAADGRRMVLEALPVLHRRAPAAANAASPGHRGALLLGAPLLRRGRRRLPIVASVVMVHLQDMAADAPAAVGGSVHWDRELALRARKIHAS